MDVAILDYDSGNLFSIRKALEHCGANVDFVTDARGVADADRLVIPGVGAFADAMGELVRRSLLEPISEFVRSGRPCLGICLGMELLFDESEEFGTHRGLGLIAGRVSEIPKEKADGARRKVPHIGWSELVLPEKSGGWQGTILQNLPETASCYFVHSFTAIPVDDRHRVADCMFDDCRLSAVVRKDNLWGCQFHPEKSGTVGLGILQNFLRIA